MQLRFRHRIGLLVALAVFGLVAVTAVTLVLGRRSERQISRIETRYLPLLELHHDVEATFAKITKALEDAASAAEEGQLVEADALVVELGRRLVSARDTIAEHGDDAVQLAAELTAYYRTARDVSAAMVAGKSAAELVTSIEQMRTAQLLLEAHLDAATTPDRSRLTAAFSAARASQRKALAIEIVVACVVLALMATLSWRMIRRMNAALQAVSDGVERLAGGELGQEIVVTSEDEFGDVARQANRTAVRLREYRDELEARNTELARASRYKTEFLANMSHELRTPLNSIMILSNVLSENDGGTLTAKQVEYATLVNRSGEELLGLINEVLDLAKIEAGKQTVEVSRVALRDVADYIRRMFTPIATQKRIGFAIERADDLPELVRTDRTRLNQIVKNLVANAIKFTERGEVRVRMFRPEPDTDTYAITVIDTGIGISAENLSTIFDAFTQANSGTSRKFGGTGLGLTIAKQLAGLLGGDLHVESTLGQGSTFTLVLPASGPSGDDVSEAPAIAPAAPPRVEHERDPKLAGKTVLIVDDDMRNLYSLSSSLQDRGLQVITATDGNDALDALDRTQHVDAILMDIMMPGLDGVETLRRIRAHARHRSVPVVAVSAGSTPDDKARWTDTGGDGYLDKPLDLAQVLGVLSGIVK